MFFMEEKRRKNYVCSAKEEFRTATQFCPNYAPLYNSRALQIEQMVQFLLCIVLIMLKRRELKSPAQLKQPLLRREAEGGEGVG